MSAKLAQLSAYGRAEEHLVRRTPLGGVITVLGSLLAVTLMLSEIRLYWMAPLVKEMKVDTKHGLLPVQLSLTLPHCPCSAVNLAVVDSSGEAGAVTTSKKSRIVKHRLDKHGKKLADEDALAWSTGGAMTIAQMAGDLVKEMSAVVNEVRAGEGCRVEGQLEVQRVAGTVIVSTGVHPHLVGIELADTLSRVSMNHTVHRLSFGPWFPGQANSLEGHVAGEPQPGVFKYFVKIVPTTYRRGLAGALETNQYSVTEYFLPTEVAEKLPGIDIVYDLSPIVVDVYGASSFLHHVTKLCAVVGGCFALTGVVNRLAHWVAGGKAAQLIADLSSGAALGGGGVAMGSSDVSFGVSAARRRAHDAPANQWGDQANW
ncbi:unnamed protein product [Pedinophyceae sp. YPF-701]|nr:unnamed protein product [Pedinophyceae sp. YPF-701]